MHGGTEWIVDAFGCAPESLRDPAVVAALLDDVVRTMELHLVGEPQVVAFPPPGGVTGLYLLAESHLAIHTFPETRIATINLYCCRPRPPLDWPGRTKHWLGASRTSVRELARGEAP